MIENDKFKLHLWEDALENERRREREHVQPLIDKYGWPLDANNMTPQDALMFDFVKPYIRRMENDLPVRNIMPHYQPSLNKGEQNNENIKLAENTLNSCKNDGKPVGLAPTSEIDDEQLLRKMGEHLKQPGIEGVVPHIYLDTVGIITAGAGANIDDKNAFISLDWTYNDERPATMAEKEEAYQLFLDFKAKNMYGQKYGANFYKDKSKLRISDEAAIALMTKHLRNDLKYLQLNLPGFNDYPEALKEVLLDICYNTGGLTKEKWPNLRDALVRKNLTDILNNVNRKKVSDTRNNWAKDKIRSIQAGNGWHW